MLTGGSPAYAAAGPVPLCCVGVREVSGKHRSCHLCHAFTAADGAPLGAHAERYNGGARPLEAKPCLAEPARTTSLPVKCRSAAEKSAES